ncbi:hypothetical protein FA95DRAFT_1611412 [Auriscalpium vulgare]|uniref:Uncharacterized protein n=1 Tax=Auriscalpium vulgare TaxID=40419 RepID=A0ACB8RBH2_9AGAM|nr:hypothetical protein FA95DRAFT_1611412 [Auriscalpium vulgare]
MSSATSFTSPTPAFTPPPLSSATPDAPTPTMPTGSSADRSQAPSSLYLYTFVATLILLVVICALLVGRGMVRRRHQHAALLEAIANGTHPPPVCPTDRPKMWEVYVGPEKKGERDVEKGWADLRPVSARVIHARQAGPRQDSPALQARGVLRRPFSLFRRAQAAPPPTPSPEQEREEDAQQHPPAPVPVQVAVLVAMPGSGRGAAHDGLPVLEIGVGVARGREEEPAPVKA